jgi:hypothetical protein
VIWSSITGMMPMSERSVATSSDRLSSALDIRKKSNLPLMVKKE